LWELFGGILVFVTGVVLASLVKKVAWLAQVRGWGGRIPGPGRGQAFWRWFSYRWRLELWWGGVALPLLLVVCALRFGDGPMDPEEVPFWNAVLGGSIVFFCLGLWACTQFWRSGENLASGESVA
jgi:hypothetical protein